VSLRRAGCHCKGEQEIRLEADLSYDGKELGVIGSMLVPCPWCNPRQYIGSSWTDVLVKALYESKGDP
jgi:hypothetical protein